jgi:hypothetical protein
MWGRARRVTAVGVIGIGLVLPILLCLFVAFVDVRYGKRLDIWQQAGIVGCVVLLILLSLIVTLVLVSRANAH